MSCKAPRQCNQTGSSGDGADNFVHVSTSRLDATLKADDEDRNNQTSAQDELLDFTGESNVEKHS